MVYYTTEARKSAQENIDKYINNINKVPGNYLDSLTVTKTVGHLLDLKKYIEAEYKIKERRGLEPLELPNKLTSDNILDSTYSEIRDFINQCRDAHFDPASLMVVNGIVKIIIKDILEKKYAM